MVLKFNRVKNEAISDFLGQMSPRMKLKMVHIYKREKNEPRRGFEVETSKE